MGDGGGTLNEDFSKCDNWILAGVAAAIKQTVKKGINSVQRAGGCKHLDFGM